MNSKEARQAGMEIWLELMDQAQFNGAPCLNSLLKEIVESEDADDYDTTIVNIVSRETNKDLK